MVSRMLSRLARVARHLACDRADVRRVFPDAALDRIEQRIAEGERCHAAELRVAIEPALGLRRVWSGTGPRDRALELFGLLRVWDTAGNNGVLIHVILADRSVEIVADRAAAEAIAPAVWSEVAVAMTEAFRSGTFVDGVLAALERLEPELARAFPPGMRNPDELPNRPVRV
jgi:uncharacterized membrane protein